VIVTVPCRQRHGACVEWLPAHGGVSVWVVFGRWVTPEDASDDLLRVASLN